MTLLLLSYAGDAVPAGRTVPPVALLFLARDLQTPTVRSLASSMEWARGSHLKLTLTLAMATGKMCLLPHPCRFLSPQDSRVTDPAPETPRRRVPSRSLQDLGHDAGADGLAAFANG